MWGNTLGWFLSLLVVLAVGAGLAFVRGRDRGTPPTGLSRDAELIGPLPASSAFASSLPPRGGGPGAGADQAKRAAEAYVADFLTYDRIARGDVPRNFDELPAIAPLIAAATSADPAVLPPLSTQVITFRAVRPPLDALQKLGACLIQAGLYHETRDPDVAARYFNAALLLGTKMYEERVVYQELVGGMTLMSEAASRLAGLTQDESRSESLRKLEVELRRLSSERLVPVWSAMGSIDDNVLARHAGDILAIARDPDADRMWRTEAALALGRLKFRAPHPRDSADARQLLDTLAEGEPDPNVRAAARAAREMTDADYRMLR